MEETVRQKRILQVIHCFKGPIHKAFLYVYSQSYSQDTDVYNYIINKGKENLFSQKELQILKLERRPAHLGFFLLYKVLRTCCTPSLAEHDSGVWLNNDILEKCSQDYKVEEILVSLVNSYRNFLRKASTFSVKDINNLMNNLNHNVSILIQKAAEILHSKRWTEEKDDLNKYFSAINNEDFKSYKSSFSDILKFEAEFRTDLYDELLSKELKTVDKSSWHLETFTCNEEGEIKVSDYEAKENIDAENIVSTAKEQSKRVCWIAGEHGVGKSVFGSFIASSWFAKENAVKGLENFSHVFVVSLGELQFQSFHEEDAFKVFFPLSSLLLGKDIIETCLEEENILVILDDINRHSEKIVEVVYEKVHTTPKLTVWFMGRLSSVLKYTKNDFYTSHAVLFELKGLREENLFSLSEDMKEHSVKELRDSLKSNMNRLSAILKYPTISYWTYQLWKESPHLMKNIYTASDLMWEILSFKVKQIIKINIKKIGPIRKKFLNWIMLAGELALYSLKADLRLDKESLEELESEITSLYKDNGKKLLDSFFKPTITHSFMTCFTSVGSTSKPFLEYLSSWFFVDQLLNNKQMSQLTNGLVYQLPLILFAAGHMERFQEEGSVTIPEERKVIKALINYREDSFDDFAFIQKFVAEMKCIKRLVEIVIDETEYNEEWNLNISEVQQKPLEVLLNHVSPTRLIFLADESKKNYELSAVMSYVCRVDISLWLDSVPQFNYGNTQTLDKLLKPFLGEVVATRVDLISGCLSSSMVKELNKAKATQHLVLLRLNISSEKKLNTALSLPKLLSHLLWLEVKLDMNYKDIELGNIKPTDVRLFDAHLRYIDDADVTFVGDLLSAMHSRYTGIHLEETSLTPEGVFSLLKDLSKKGISLRAEDDSIAKFRRWYYPALSSLPKWKQLTEQETIELIGHDDRDFFSDHHVKSSQFVTALDTWNLRNYLEGQKSILHFIYEASNIMFTKILDGTVDIEFKGDYRETIKDKVIDRVGDEMGEGEVENEVMDLY